MITFLNNIHEKLTLALENGFNSPYEIFSLFVMCTFMVMFIRLFLLVIELICYEIDFSKFKYIQLLYGVVIILLICFVGYFKETFT